MTKEEILAAVNAITLELDGLLQGTLLEDHIVTTQARILEVRQIINAITLNIDKAIPNSRLIEHLQAELTAIHEMFDGVLVPIESTQNATIGDSPVIVDMPPDNEALVGVTNVDSALKG